MLLGASCMDAIQLHELGAQVLHALSYQVEWIQHSHAMLHFACLQRRQASLAQGIAALDVHSKEAFACVQDACLLCRYAMHDCAALSAWWTIPGNPKMFNLQHSLMSSVCGQIACAAMSCCMLQRPCHAPP